MSKKILSTAATLITISLFSSAALANGDVTLIGLFEGQFDNTKYSIEVTDPDGIVEFLVSVNPDSGCPSNPSCGLFGGEPPGMVTVTSGTVTILPEFYPLDYYIVDTFGNISEGQVDCPERQECSRPTEEQLIDLSQLVVSINLQGGISNSLDQKLTTALNALDDVNENNDIAALNNLYAFCSSVQAQRGQKLTEAQGSA